MELWLTALRRQRWQFGEAESLTLHEQKTRESRECWRSAEGSF